MNHFSGTITDGHGKRINATPITANQALDELKTPHILINPGKVTIVLRDKDVPTSKDGGYGSYLVAIHNALLLAAALRKETV